MELRANQENEEHEEDDDGEDYQGQRMEGIHNHSSDSKDMPIDYRATMKKSDIVGLVNSGRNVITSAPYSPQY